jgi:hypothetical protein
MQNIDIKDLPLKEDLDSNTMAAIKGGISPQNTLAPPTRLIQPGYIPKPIHGTPGHGGDNGDGGGGGGGGSYNDGPYGGEDLHETD